MNMKRLICDADWFLALDHFIIILHSSTSTDFSSFASTGNESDDISFSSLCTRLVLKSVSTRKNTACNFKRVARLQNVLLDLPSQRFFDFFKLLIGMYYKNKL